MPKWLHQKNAIKEPTTHRQGDQFAIIGPYGNVWHDDTFPSVEDAERYLRDFWRGDKTFDLGEWRVALATVEITALEPSWRFAAQGMSAGTAKTAKRVEAEGRQPGSAKRSAPNE